MRIVFHGENAASFSDGFASLVPPGSEIAILPDSLTSDADRATYAAADAIIGVGFNASMPRPENLRLFHVPGAGYDAVDLAALPPSAAVCNVFGHQDSIAEYVMAALLARAIPFTDADRRLRQGDWTYWAGAPERVHGEISGTSIGLLGYGHIGKAIATRARAFNMRVTVANRSPVNDPLVAQSFPLTDLASFWASADAFVVSLPLTGSTAGLVNSAAFAAMPPHAVIINVGRGPVIDETALYDALSSNRIAGAIIDTWYQYPSAATPNPLPSSKPFHTLPNIVMTPHMSGWTSGTITRRQALIAANIRACAEGTPYQNRVR